MACSGCDNKVTLSMDVANNRLAICRKCIQRRSKKIPITKVIFEWCNVCKCPLVTRTHASCPEGKW
jgi:hypothetical protein